MRSRLPLVAICTGTFMLLIDVTIAADPSAGVACGLLVLWLAAAPTESAARDSQEAAPEPAAR